MREVWSGASTDIKPVEGLGSLVTGMHQPMPSNTSVRSAPELSLRCHTANAWNLHDLIAL